MKKLFLIALVILSMTAVQAQHSQIFEDYYLFQTYNNYYDDIENEGLNNTGTPNNPGGHGSGGDQPAPLGGGLLLLAGFGVAYAGAKARRFRKEE